MTFYINQDLTKSKSFSKYTYFALFRPQKFYQYFYRYKKSYRWYTGIPLVDACMRCLKATGWINFRMRAMLVSFLCHHLDCDWRLGVYHLARLFLDYEPGIHYPQFQMQAGTWGKYDTDV